MKIQIFSVYDSKADAYLQPFFSMNTDTALRAIDTVLQDPNHQFSKYAEDFTLFGIGEFDDAKGHITGYQSFQNLGNLKSFSLAREVTEKLDGIREAFEVKE